MFLLDNILFAPIHGLTAICRKVHEAAQEDLEAQEQATLAALAELHQQLDGGGISEEEFNARESALLDHLEACQAARGRNGDGNEEDDEEEDAAADTEDDDGSEDP
jgi:hypothetical protein